MSQSLKKGIHPRRANSIRTSYLAKHKVFVLKNQHYFIYSKYNSIALGPTILSSEILTGNRSWLLPCLEYILINKMWEQSKFFGLKRIEQQSINIFLNFCENGRKELENCIFVLKFTTNPNNSIALDDTTNHIRVLLTQY